MKWIARYRIRKAINYHQRMADTLWYIKEQGVCTSSYHHQKYINDMEHRGDREFDCARRLEKLLNKYS